MTSQPPRSYTWVAAAIIIAGVLVSASLYATIGQPEKTVTSTSTSTSIEYTTESWTTTLTSSSTTTSTLFITTASIQTTISTVTDTATEAETSTTTETVTSETVMPFYGLVMLVASSSCSVSYGSTSYPALCWGNSDPIVFNCAAEAATPQGCSQQVDVSGTPITLTAWYPYAASNGSEWQDCKVTESLPSPPGPQTAFGYYISLNSTSFIVAMPAPPPA